MENLHFKIFAILPHASRVGIYTDANLPLPGKVAAFQAMRPIVGNEAGAA